MIGDLSRICARRAALLRELAELEESLGLAVSETLRPTPVPDETLSLSEAAAYLGEPPETVCRRLEYRKALLALLTRPDERRLRYSRAELERVKRDRLAGNAAR